MKSLLFLFILFIAFSVSFGKKYNCKLSNNGKTCTISRLKLTRDDYEIEPVVTYFWAIERFEFQSSTVPILASGICDVMPNLKEFYADSVSLEEIEENAFNRCKGLTKISIRHNNLSILPKTTFKGLNELKELRIFGGNLPVFDVDLTDLKELSLLSLCSLSITEFSPGILRAQKKLWRLDLYSNNLYDLNVEELLNFTPKLIFIDLADNNFKCSRLKAIITILKQKKYWIINLSCIILLKKTGIHP